MNIFDALFGLALIILFGTEFYVLITKKRNPDQTFSHKLIDWMKEKHTKRRRILVGTFVLWLFYHFVFQSF